ncbi:MAG TPA: PAS domain-containing protein [Terriglobales bacterium]|nr:PAS domain-containing protein [Terriglobales bacterium]
MSAETTTIETLRKQTEIPVIIFDQDGRLIFANEALERVLTWRHGELLGLPVSTVLPNRFLSIPEPDLLPRRPVPGTACQSDGKLIDTELTLVAGTEGAVLHYAVMIRPLTEQHWFHYIPFEEEV